MKILLGITGSVAAVLASKIFAGFEGDDVRIVITEAAGRFTAVGMTGPVPRRALFTDMDESHWQKVGDPILHIELRNWMDVLVIAPLSANSLGKMANGVCDNLLMSVWLASGKKPVVVAPAMNTQMWTHPAVEKNVSTLRDMGVTIVEPVVKTLACGETGIGAMAPISNIVAETRYSASAYQRIKGCAP